MMLPFTELVARYHMAIKGVIHCGARLGEEAEEYTAAGIANVWWVEANPGVLDQLRAKVHRYGHKVIPALLTDQDGEWTTFNVTNHDGMSSSILEFGTHPTFSPDTVFVDKIVLRSQTLDSVVDEWHIRDCNLLVMDLQGAEGHCLRGAARLLKSIDYVVSEINTKEVYVGAVQLPDLEALLSDFTRVETHMVADQGWGDALFVRSSLL